MHTSHLSWIRRTGLAAAVLFTVPIARAVLAPNSYAQHNLVSDIPGLADQTDPLLLNPWGLASSASSPWWVGDNHSGFSTLYNGSGVIQSMIVQVPPPGTNAPPAAPTGVIFNGTTNFEVSPGNPARFIFVTEDGTISAWNAVLGTNAVVKVDNSASGAIYKGLTMASTNGNNRLYAADFHNGKVDVFDASFSPVALPAGAFTDTNLPAGYAPFGIRSFGGQIFVTYALQDAAGEDDVPGGGHGYIDAYDPDGHFIKRFASQGTLNSPWGMAMAPANFGAFSGALLVGNFGNGRINGFDPATGTLLGQLQDSKSNIISISGLWDIQFGNGANAGSTNTLYFTAGISAGEGVESHGLFGNLSVVDPIQLSSISVDDLTVRFSWSGGAGPYLLQKKSSLTNSSWFNVLTTPQQSVILPRDDDAGFYRLMDQATNQVVPFTVLMNGPSEVPSNSSPAVAVGLISLEGTNLSWHIRFSGLTTNATAAHIHAPGGPTNAVGVMLPLTVPSATAGIISGTAGLTTAQLTNILTGKAYVNIHDVPNPNGEIRGQIMPLHVRLDMNGASEVPPINTAGQASGTLTFIGSDLIYSINFTRLTSSATLAHIHGPADTTHSTGVLVPLASPTNTSGTLSGSVVLTPAQLDLLLSGNTYVNIHTLTNGAGEIRGQIMPQQYVVIMDAAHEIPPTVSDGFAHGLLTVNGSQLAYTIPYAGLTSDAQRRRTSMALRMSLTQRILCSR